MKPADPRGTYDFDRSTFYADARVYARELYAHGNSLAHDLTLLCEFMPGDAPDGFVDEMVRAFLSAWIIESIQPVTTSPYSAGRRQALKGRRS